MLWALIIVSSSMLFSTVNNLIGFLECLHIFLLFSFHRCVWQFRSNRSQYTNEVYMFEMWLICVYIWNNNNYEERERKKKQIKAMFEMHHSTIDTHHCRLYSFVFMIMTHNFGVIVHTNDANFHGNGILITNLCKCVIFFDSRPHFY